MVVIGCSRKTTGLSTAHSREMQGDGKYDYVLSEAIRQKYVGETGQATVLFEKCIEIDKKRSVPYFELAQIYAGMGEQNKALSYASKAANLDVNNYWYQLACASLFTQYERKDSAIVYFQRALNADQGAMEVYMALAGLYYEKGEIERADSLFQILDKAGLLDEQMYMILISRLLEEKKYLTAAERTRSLVEKFPQEIRYRALLANIYSEAGENEKSDSIYARIIRESPEDAESQLLVLASLVNKKEYAGASAFLSSVIKSSEIERERKVALIRDLVLDSAYLESQSKALEINMISLEGQFPNDEEVVALRPSMYEEQGRIEDAILQYEKLLERIKPGYFLKERLILLYAGNEEFEKLYSIASGYATENNRSILGKVYYAVGAMELKKYEIAEAELKKAMILAGNDNQIKLQILSMMGDLKYRMKDFQGAFKYLEEALSINPNDIVLLNNYAYFLAENGSELPKALKMIERVMEVEGTNPTYQDTYAWVLYKTGKNKEAYDIMKEIMKNSEKKDSEILEHMGYILKALSKCGEAVEFWRKALEADGSRQYLIREIELCGEANKE